MSLYSEAFGKLFNSILGSDFLILVVSFIDVVSLLFTLWLARTIKKRAEAWRQKKNVEFSAFLLHGVSLGYTVFVTIISLFPLLGMLGTVIGLLGLDLASGDMENIKNNFFIALTSTAWGIIFSVFFKFINAFVADGIEKQIEVAKKLSEELNI